MTKLSEVEKIMGELTNSELYMLKETLEKEIRLSETAIKEGCEDKKENSCFNCENEEGTHEVDSEYWCLSCYSSKIDHDYEMIKDRKVYIV